MGHWMGVRWAFDAALVGRGAGWDCKVCGRMCVVWGVRWDETARHVIGCVCDMGWDGMGLQGIGSDMTLALFLCRQRGGCDR